ncbi:MAG TPA: transglycosylase SLT domain-containing protein [Burkholderiaceae bacterium]|nr:transglycosylase SLT domain-containing protein [Burkholderiaceae bacterium]
MRDPRWIAWLFGLFVRLLGAGRFTRAAWPMLAVAASGSVVMLSPVMITDASVAQEGAVLLPTGLATLSEVRRVVEAAIQEPGKPVVTVAAVTAPPPAAAAQPPRPTPFKPAATPLQLSKEQANLAQFIAGRYRVALDNTQLFVDGAYKAAREYKMDPWLLLAVMAVESSFDPDATSHRGAHGLMQVLTRVHTEKFAPFGGVAAAFDPIANIKVGTRILRDYIARDGSVEGGLKAYVGAALLDDDRGYGVKVLAERERLAAAAAGKGVPNLPSRPAVPEKPAVAGVDAAPAPAAATGDGARARDAIMELIDNVMSGSTAAHAAPMSPATAAAEGPAPAP